MQLPSLNCAGAREIDLVNYLESLGFSPQKVRGHEWWFLSPLRVEKTPSFKVDRRKNLWYDHGVGRGGDLIDFGTLFHGCSVKEFLQKLAGAPLPNFSFHPPFSLPNNDAANTEKKIILSEVRALQDIRLCQYLSSRKIPPSVAKEYVKEIAFEMKRQALRSDWLSKQQRRL
jgi:DNA primase